MDKQCPKIVWLALVGALFSWASAYIGIRIGLTQYSPGGFGLLRFIAASLTMLVIYLRLPHRNGLQWRDASSIFLLGVIGFALYSVTLNYGEITVQAAIAGFLIATIPIGMIILARIFLKEKPTLRGLMGIFISFTGIILISLGESEGVKFNFGVLYILCAVVAGSIYSTFQKSLLMRYHPIEFTAYTIWSGTLALAFYTPQLWHELPHASLKATLWGIYLGIFPAALGYLAWSYVIRYITIAKAASTLYIVPVISIFLGWFFINEMPNRISLLGGFVVLTGAIIVNYRKRIRKRDTQTQLN